MPSLEPVCSGLPRPRLGPAVVLPASFFSRPDPAAHGRRRRGHGRAVNEPEGMMSTDLNFDVLGLDPVLTRALADAGYERPTDVQQRAIPPALEGRDLR